MEILAPEALLQENEKISSNKTPVGIEIGTSAIQVSLSPSSERRVLEVNVEVPGSKLIAGNILLLIFFLTGNANNSNFESFEKPLGWS